MTGINFIALDTCRDNDGMNSFDRPFYAAHAREDVDE